VQSPVDLSLVIACYKDAPHLRANVRILERYLAATRLAYEFILVEDGSMDETLAEVRLTAAELAQQGVPVRVIEHERNQGRGAAVQDGFLAASGTVVGFIDIDLEHSHDALLSMYLRIASGECDGVVAKRLYESTKVNPLRLVMSVTYKRLVRLVTDLPVRDTEAGLKLFRRAAILPVLPSVEDRRWFWDTEVVARAADAGLVLADHPIIFTRNAGKQSTVRVVRDSVEYLVRLASFVSSRARPRAAPAERQVLPGKPG
jgi:glycosyltransferase involved in cell wall biosynthesis